MVELPTHLRGASVGKRTLTRAELAAHQRDRVIAKATPVFARRGYQETSVDDILAAAKVGVGNFYSLFEGKENCFLACLDLAIAEAWAAMVAAVSGVGEWERRAYLGLAALLDRLTFDPLGARLVLVEAQCAGVEATARYDTIIDRAVAWLADGRRVRPEAAGVPASFEAATIPGLAFYLQQCLLVGPIPSAEVLLAETAELLLGPMIGAENLRRLARERRAPAPA